MREKLEKAILDQPEGKVISHEGDLPSQESRAWLVDAPIRFDAVATITHEHASGLWRPILLLRGLGDGEPLIKRIE